MSSTMRLGVSRRNLLKGLAATTLAAPFIRPSYAATTVRISNFGGFFEKAFSEHVYPAFTKATGIAVQSMPQAGSSEFLIQLAQANRAGSAPMDVCCAAQEDVIRGRQQGVWHMLDEGKLPNMSNIPQEYTFKSEKGVDGVGAMAWYITLIVNPEEFKSEPTSWKVLWEDRPSAWGLQASGGSTLLEVAAASYFGGTEILNTREGIDKVLAKIAELKPNVKLWWKDEGSMQTAFQNEEVVGGMYFHDVATIMKKEGTPLSSIFPAEGAVQGFNAWCVPSNAKAVDEALAFINWSATPECHQLIARNVGAAPLIPRAKLDLTDEEFAAVASESKPILVNSAAKVEHADYLAQQFLKTIAG